MTNVTISRGVRTNLLQLQRNAALRLRALVIKVFLPFTDRRFVPPELQGHEAALVGQALKPLDGNEPVDVFHLGPHGLGDFKTLGALVRLGGHFENHGGHGGSSFGSSGKKLSHMVEKKPRRFGVRPVADTGHGFDAGVGKQASDTGVMVRRDVVGRAASEE